jgi:hypothetical protein
MVDPFRAAERRFMHPFRTRVFAACLLCLTCLLGCSQQAPTAHGPVQPTAVDFQKLSIDGSTGTRVVCPHYIIQSTFADSQILHRVAEVMEGALGEYRALAPEIPLSSRPMECYFFETREQWAAFTQAHTGEDARIYLRVNRGGYTVGDWFVAYWIGENATYSVAAHEGWHQYVARHLKGRLPPFLEEGTACLFEQVEWEGELPRWNLSDNESRLMSLRSADAGKQLYPLPQLIRMHAGQVVGKPAGKIEAFYAQSWAFARFLYDGNGGRNQQALRHMLTDAAHGTLYGDNSRELPEGPMWDPSTAKPMLEHYLQKSLPQIDQEFAAYIQELVNAQPPPTGG